MDGTILIANLICVRVKTAVGSNYSIAAERIISRVIIIEITAIDENMVSAEFCRIHRPSEGLVNKIPYKATLIFRIFAYKIPVFLETTH